MKRGEAFNRCRTCWLAFSNLEKAAEKVVYGVFTQAIFASDFAERCNFNRKFPIS
jgi:hypothetical protein